jgi:hypothetical protein
MSHLDDITLARARHERQAAWHAATQRLRRGGADLPRVVRDLRTAYARAWTRYERPIAERRRRASMTYILKQRGSA